MTPQIHLASKVDTFTGIATCKIPFSRKCETESQYDQEAIEKIGEWTAALTGFFRTNEIYEALIHLEVIADVLEFQFEDFIVRNGHGWSGCFEANRDFINHRFGPSGIGDAFEIIYTVAVDPKSRLIDGPLDKLRSLPGFRLVKEHPAGKEILGLVKREKWWFADQKWFAELREHMKDAPESRCEVVVSWSALNDKQREPYMTHFRDISDERKKVNEVRRLLPNEKQEAQAEALGWKRTRYKDRLRHMGLTKKRK